ncbi:hypothetical protein BX616_002377 [Lobosporangium transversale]|nr:hypothetical protein BX616_002377 [Lobosporangium transversale]
MSNIPPNNALPCVSQTPMALVAEMTITNAPKSVAATTSSQDQTIGSDPTSPILTEKPILTLAPALDTGRPLTSGFSLSTWQPCSIPSYLRPYVSNEAQLKNNATDTKISNSGNSNSSITSPSLSTTLFSQSRELRFLLDKISSFDAVLENMQRCSTDFEKRLATDSRSVMEKLVSTLEPKVVEKVSLILDHAYEDLAHVVQKCISDTLKGKQDQNVQGGFEKCLQDMAQTVKAMQKHVCDLQNERTALCADFMVWKSTIEETLQREMKELKAMATLQPQMLSLIAEQNQTLKNGSHKLQAMAIAGCSTVPDYYNDLDRQGHERLETEVNSQHDTEEASNVQGRYPYYSRHECTPDRTLSLRPTIQAESQTSNYQMPTSFPKESYEKTRECDMRQVNESRNVIMDRVTSNVTCVFNNAENGDNTEVTSTRDKCVTMISVDEVHTAVSDSIMKHSRKRKNINLRQASLSGTVSPCPREQQRDSNNKAEELGTPTDVKDESMDILEEPLLTRRKRKMHRLENSHVDLEWLKRRS